MKNLGTLWVAAVLLVAISCKESKKKERFLPPSTGSVNSVMVVMDNELWRGAIGDKVRELFARPALSLMPEQPILSLTQIPPNVFLGATAHSRSVLFVQQDSVTVSHVKTDVYAQPQKVAVVKGTNYAELVGGLESVAENAITEFKRIEISEAQERFKRSLNKEKALQETFGVSMTIPSAYRVGKQEANFVWLDRQIPKGNMNIVVYSMPESSFSNDSTFVRDIVSMRDSIGKKYIPGPDDGTFMITEKAFAPYLFPAEVGGLKGAEARGIWEINGYPMAGPFLTYILNDQNNNRKLIVEGFTFAPSTQKRDYMFELEAILKTLRVQ
ncbi:DUF4837 family protein [Muricauda sp. SCSIO 64092]|uniref:DUF4837 family protein n=1 Tax=Allomuricauda sp. SCSIO 64092 TaxID=2908842 RepID=UPI001FF4AE36|nr:DUF4837 family protein [Muricauda sp. SCSIO 64092]UOY08846.1 DUF4837 family protein [Muricauda sp. SCSIO 64092]